MEQNVLVTKMIGIVVAVIVAAVVLVPICNSLTEGDGSSDGGSGGSSSTVPVDGNMLNSINDVLVDDGVTSTYTGYDVYPDDRGYVAPISFTKDDAQGYLDSVTKTGDMYYNTVNIPIIRINNTPMGSTEDHVESMEIGVLVNKSDGSKDTYLRAVLGYGGDIVSIVDESLSAYQTVSITIREDATADITIVGGSSNVSLTVSDTVDEVLFLSDSENCWMFFNLTPASDYLVVEEGSAIQVGLMLGAMIDGERTMAIRGATVELTADMISNLQATTTFTGTFASENYNITVSIPLRYNDNTDKIYLDRSAEGTISGEYNQELYVEGYGSYVSTMNVVPASGGSPGGDSSGSSDLGVAGTIIGIIPVFVILAILMGAVGLFYQNRKTI